jgi:uncharacterized protein YbjQ (UPF0145 family)
VPLFHHKSDEGKRLEEDAKQHQQQEASLAEASLAALQSGGIPIHAQRRLEELRARHDGFFTSDLSVNEFLLTRRAGLRPLSQVMGSSIYHVGWRYLGRTMGSGEIASVTDALNEARILALGRLKQEAQGVGADIVVGVHLNRAGYEWAADVIEFSAVGTAMKLERAASGDEPALTNLSGQDFWKLYENGYWPVGVVGGSSVFHAVPSWGAWRATSTFYGGLWNQELIDFTQGLYTARHHASSRMQAEALRLSCAGVVGVEIDQATEEYRVSLGNEQERTDMIVTFQTLGTAIVPLLGHSGVIGTVTQSLNLSS